MAFWTDAQQGQDPKRKFRFLVTLGNMPNGARWFAKTVKKPNFQITEVTHQFLNHTFYYPGRMEWQTTDVVLVDPVSPDAAAATGAIIKASGYNPPTDQTDTRTISKKDSVKSLGRVSIEQIDAEGNMVERWVLWNAFIQAVDYGDLDYSADEMSEITLTLRYDWAELITANAAEVGGSNPYSGDRKFFSTSD